MLNETARNTLAVSFSTKYINNPTLRHAIKEASYEPLPEIDLLNAAVRKTNQLIISTTVDPDLSNTNSLKGRLVGLPTMFDWKNRIERRAWTLSLMQTFQAINTEIGDFYTRPEEINEGNPADVFRFFLLDGYARWAAITFLASEGREIEQATANTVINALCEATVVLAEQNSISGTTLVKWMKQHDWIKKSYGFTTRIVGRACLLK